MARTSAATIVDESWDLNSGISWGRTYGNAGHSGDGYYLFILKFITPAFSGKSSKIKFDLSMKIIVNVNVTLRYALCTDTANSEKYYKTIGSVNDDENQIAAGVKTFSLKNEYDTYSIEVETKDLKPNSTYYLFIWAGSSYSITRLAAKEKHAVTLTHKANGGVRIKTSTASNVLHAVIIYTSNGWKRYAPIVWDGSKWKRQG